MLASVVTGHFIELFALFGMVFVHELGHVAAARMLGVTVISVQLLPFGGVAIMEDSGNLTARKEIVIALAGPLQNLWMIGAGLLLKTLGLWSGSSLDYFIEANLILVMFNLLPVLPLDGGKICQALCSLLVPYHASLLWSSRLSVFFSALVLLYALYPLTNHGGVQLNLCMIGTFLLYSNIVDHRNIPFRFLRFLVSRERFLTGSLPVARPIVADAAKPLDKILRLLKREKYHFVYILNPQGDLVAIVPEQRLIAKYLSVKPKP
ncbi:Zn-dependent protease [Paenibacillus sp. CAA11]|nr:Zn-dependent protease [Paenibacillus sp. CAA11]